MSMRHVVSALVFVNAPIAAQVAIGIEGQTNANHALAAAGRFVVVGFSSATAAAMDVYLAASQDGGRTFAAPVRVNHVPGQARVSADAPVRVALRPRRGAAPEVAVIWTAKRGADWLLLSARSTDGGRTFSNAVPVPGSDAVGVRGWHSVAVDAAGRPYVLWIDHRETVAADSIAKVSPPTGPRPAAGPHADPTARAGLSTVLLAPLEGSGPATRLASSPCYCCKTTLVASRGSLLAVWRHVFPEGERDIAFARSADQGRTFTPLVRVSPDRWKFDGCPDDGPTAIEDASRTIHVVWPTPVGGRGVDSLTLYHAATRDGKTFGPRTRLPVEGPAGHSSLGIARDGTTLVGWDEVVAGVRRGRIAGITVSAGGVARFTPRSFPATANGQQHYPVFATTDQTTLVAWGQRVERRSQIMVAAIP